MQVAAELLLIDLEAVLVVGKRWQLLNGAFVFRSIALASKVDKLLLFALLVA